jgi:hypothetical protein
MTASSDMCPTQPESVLEGPCSEVTAPLSAEKYIVASRPVTIKEAQGDTNETTRQVEKLTTVGAMPDVGTNTEVLPAAPQVQAAPVKANEHAAAIGKVKSMVSQFEKELSAGTSSAGSGGGCFAVQPRSEKETVPVAENIADVTGGNMLPGGGGESLLLRTSPDPMKIRKMSPEFKSSQHDTGRKVVAFSLVNFWHMDEGFLC